MKQYLSNLNKPPVNPQSCNSFQQKLTLETSENTNSGENGEKNRERASELSALRNKARTNLRLATQEKSAQASSYKIVLFSSQTQQGFVLSTN